jgi:phosphoribosyl 1,2-cyclic phosphodiesterase
VRVFVLGSGSSGNCFVVESQGERLVVEAGMGPTRAVERMRAMGADFVTARPALGVLVTHEHGDHAAHALPLSRAQRAPILAHDGITLPRTRRRTEVRSYTPGRALTLGPFLIESLAVPHDAPQVAVRVSAGGWAFALATDLGVAPKGLRPFLSECDLVFLESNHCPRLLETGPYPPRLRTRVAGGLGHLANEQAAEVAASLDHTRVGRLVLVHLSRVNNTPERARDVVSSRVRRMPVDVLAQGEARRFDVSAGARAGAAQMAFGF